MLWLILTVIVMLHLTHNQLQDRLKTSESRLQRALVSLDAVRDQSYSKVQEINSLKSQVHDLKDELRILKQKVA